MDQYINGLVASFEAVLINNPNQRQCLTLIRHNKEYYIE